MAFFDNLKEKVADLAQAGVAKSKQLAEIAKLKAANMAEQDAIRKAYLEIGKLYYAEKGATPEGGYAAACEKITTAKANIAANNAKIENLKDGDEEVAAAAADAVIVEEIPAIEVLAEDVTAEDIADEQPKAE
ncbi:MAG: serine proteinase [Oscillospiraceae bacterium]|nr:serine proteinase [Oscillospiraceae bacterium]